MFQKNTKRLEAQSNGWARFFFVFFFYRFVAFLALLSVLVVGVVHLCSVGLSAKLRALVRGRKPALFPTQCTLSVYLQTNICCS